MSYDNIILWGEKWEFCGIFLRSQTSDYLVPATCTPDNLEMGGSISKALDFRLASCEAFY